MSEVNTKFYIPSRFNKEFKNIWIENQEISDSIVNLGMGFPDYPPPVFMLEALDQAINSEDCLLHQYTRRFGHPTLVQNLAKLYSPLFKRNLDYNKEIIITSGAYGALKLALCAFIEVNDEVIIMEPFFDCYQTLVIHVGGTPKYITLRQKDETGSESSQKWILDHTDLEQLFNKNTKAIILNTPHNPLGKVFSQNELTQIASLCVKWNVLCISDEAYEWVIFDNVEHIRIATLPGMWERTITIGCAGKTFGVTGWKLGWIFAHENFMHNLHLAHVYYDGEPATMIQEALAIVIDKYLNCNTNARYFLQMPHILQEKRDMLMQILIAFGLKPITPSGAFYIVADWSPLANRITFSGDNGSKDEQFVKWLMKNVGVVGIPLSNFYCTKNKSEGERFVRFCFAKSDSTLEEARKKFLSNHNSCGTL